MAKQPTPADISKKYAGHVRRIQELHDATEDAGWKLAEFIYMALRELRKSGVAVIGSTADYNNPSTAISILARHINRERFGAASVMKYRLVWLKFGDKTKRHAGLNFADHYTLARYGEAKQQTVAKELAKTRRYLNSTGAAGVASNGQRAEKPERPVRLMVNPHRYLSDAGSALRRVLNQDLHTFPDLDKVIENLDEIDLLLSQMYKRVEQYDKALKEAS